jgi:iron complex transport system substrate-binding protein
MEWIDPPMASGNWIPELVEMAGGVEIIGEAGKPSRRISWEVVLGADPEALIVLPCGFDIRRSREELRTLEQKPGWSNLRAVRAGRVYLTDGNQYFNRPGPRLVESLEILAEILHPGVFRFEHRNRDWERASAGV